MEPYYCLRDCMSIFQKNYGQKLCVNFTKFDHKFHLVRPGISFYSILSVMGLYQASANFWLQIFKKNIFLVHDPSEAYDENNYKQSRKTYKMCYQIPLANIMEGVSRDKLLTWISVSGWKVSRALRTPRWPLPAAKLSAVNRSFVGISTSAL